MTLRAVRNALVPVAFAFLLQCGARAADPEFPPGTRLNQIQVIGTHNSYKRAIQRELFQQMRTVRNGVEGLDYAHLSLTDQLNLGVRTMEIDVYYDPEGGRYADPLGNRMLRASGGNPDPVDDPEGLATPGFKCIHDADFDFRTWHVTLEGALAELGRWSEEHPGHLPIIVTMNTKQSDSGVPGAVHAARFDANAMRKLNATVFEWLGEDRLITPDSVRGDAQSLESVILSRGWPELSECLGRFLFVLDEGGSTRETYLSAFPNLEAAAYFTLTPPGNPTAGFLIINDPVRDGERIRGLVERGYMVRTRADASTREARSEDYTRFEAAKACGAQAIKTDYPVPDRRLSETYMVRFDDGGFARLNPVSGNEIGDNKAAGE